MEELLNKALLVQKQTKKYCFANATVIAISTILFFDYGALAGSYRQDSKMPKCQNNLGEAVVFINGNSDKQKPLLVWLKEMKMANQLLFGLIMRTRQLNFSNS